MMEVSSFPRLFLRLEPVRRVPQALDEDFRALGHAVVVVERADEGRVEEIEGFAVPDDAAGAVDVRREDRELIGFAFAVRATDDAAAVEFGVERAVLVDADEDGAVGRGGGVGGIADVGRRGQEGQVEAGRDLDVAEERLVVFLSPARTRGCRG